MADIIYKRNFSVYEVLSRMEDATFYISPFCYGSDKVKIGEICDISPGCVLITGKNMLIKFTELRLKILRLRTQFGQWPLKIL